MTHEGEEAQEQNSEQHVAPAPSNTSEGASAQAADNNYPGPLGIWKNTNLTDAEQRIEQAFAEQLQSDVAYWMREYLRRNGRILDTDLARVLSAEWNFNNESRALLTTAVHNPASAFINALYDELLQQPIMAPQDTVLFMAGGGGSGKTSTIQLRVAAMLDRVCLTYDTTFSRLEPAQQKVEAALAAGKQALIVYVYRPFDAAVRGVIDRSLSNGRTVPLNVLAGDHVGAPQTVLQLANIYTSHTKVRIRAIDNSATDVSEAVMLPRQEMLSFLQNLAYTQVEDLHQHAQEVLRDEITRREGTFEPLPEYIITTLNRGYV